MSKYNFDNIVNRYKTHSVKWDVRDNELPMWVADMDYHVLPEIKQAIIDRTNVDAYGYVECPQEYYLAYQSWWNRHHHVKLDTSWMMFVTGVLAGLDSIFKHHVKPRSGVIILTPVYHAFFNCIKNNDLECVPCELIYKDHQYDVNYEELEELLKQDNNKTLLLCNPHNPIGRIWSKEELTKIVDLCDKYNVLIISDEIHCDIVEPGYEYTSIFSVTDKHIALLSPTKVFNLAGIQTACVVIKDKALHDKIQEGLWKDDVGEPNYLSPFACIAAYTYGDTWVKELNEYIFNNKKYVINYLKDNLPELYPIDIKATYLMWIDVSKVNPDSELFVKDLRDKTGLFVSKGKQFGKGGEGFIRMNIATSLDNVKDACERLKKYIKKEPTE